MTATTISEFISIIKRINSETKSRMWFRGQANKNWELKPSIWRSFSRETERHINHEYLWKAKSRMIKHPDAKDWVAWLSIMQHYRLPTRLLDWSKSPLVALYFALETYILDTNKNPENDAVVWVLNPWLLNHFSGLEEPYLFSVYNELSRDMIIPAFTNPKYSSENNKIIAVSAIENDIRMLVQQSAFTIHSSLDSLELYTTNKKILTKIIIPKESLGEFAWELELMGITTSFIYPDPEHLASEISTGYLRKVKLSD